MRNRRVERAGVTRILEVDPVRSPGAISVAHRRWRERSNQAGAPVIHEQGSFAVGGTMLQGFPFSDLNNVQLADLMSEF